MTESKNLGATLYFKDETHNLACDVLARKGFSSAQPSVTGAAKLASMLNEHAALSALEASVREWLCSVEDYGTSQDCDEVKIKQSLANLAAIRANISTK